jgi:RND superfamily putative drug exporter
LHEENRVASFLGGVTRLVNKAPIFVLVGWIVAAVAMTLLPPSLNTVVLKTSTPLLPATAPSSQAFKVMDREFGSGRAKSFTFVVIINDSGLTELDQQTYKDLVATLKAHPEHVAAVQDFLESDQLKQVFTSKDGKAIYLPVGITAESGTPKANSQVYWIQEQLKKTPHSSQTDLGVTGAPVILADLTTTLNNAAHTTTIVTLVLLLLVLFVIYRRPVTMFLPIVVIGVALQVTRGTLSLLGMQGFPVSSYTNNFVVAICLGAGTDYCLFLISRFRENYRDAGGNPAAIGDAVVNSVKRVGPALLASSMTVMLASVCMSLTQLSLFSTTGPGMAICVLVTITVALTLGPALLKLFGHRIGPAKPVNSNSAWYRTGRIVASNPKRYLLLGMTPILLLVVLVPTMTVTFHGKGADASGIQESPLLKRMVKHFPQAAASPDYVIIKTDKDLGVTANLNAIHSISQQLEKTPGVEKVYSITQPTGEPIEAAKISTQLEQMNDQFGDASEGIKLAGPQLEMVQKAAKELGPGFTDLADAAASGAVSIGEITSSLGQLKEGLDGSSTRVGSTADSVRSLSSLMATTAVILQNAHDNVAETVQGLEVIVQNLDDSWGCSQDQTCTDARDALRQLQKTQSGALEPGLRNGARAARNIAENTDDLSGQLDDLKKSLDQARRGLKNLTSSTASLQGNLGDAADASGKIAEGANSAGDLGNFLDKLKELLAGIGKARSFISAAGGEGGPISSGFYLPSTALNDPRLEVARVNFLNSDLDAARIQLVPTQEPDNSPSKRYNAIRKNAEAAVKNSSLKGADIYISGPAATEHDLGTYSVNDGMVVVIAAILVILLVLILSLRALAAPLYLLATVVLSSLAAMGFTILSWQYIVGSPIHFTVPAMVFVVLVAVGADYNIILMSRLREDGIHVDKHSVAEAVGVTGPVISSAGVIFAATFLALMSSPVLAVQQIGYGIAAGLIMDTFLVRGVIVPAVAAWFGPNNWWPFKDAAAKITEAPKRAQRRRPTAMKPGYAPTSWAAEWMAPSEDDTSEDVSAEDPDTPPDPDRPHAGVSTK